MPRAYRVLGLCWVVAFAACERVRVRVEDDGGPICPADQSLVNGVCRFVCTRDSDCASAQRCDVLVGQCVARTTAADAGRVVLCTEGAERCRADNKAVERCGVDGGWSTNLECPGTEGFCQNDRCLACRPGTARCPPTPLNVAEVCKSDGSGYRSITCAGAATCQAGLCAECGQGMRRCSPDGKSVQECQRQPREELALGYVDVGDNFDGTCITQQCTTTGGVPACVAPACVPGTQQCQSLTTLQVCGATGAWQSQVCASLPGATANSECQNGACVDECADAVRQKSYFGCEYWTTVMDNGVAPAEFKAGTLQGQGTTDSEFAFVVSNRSSLPARVVVRRWRNGAEETVKDQMVPGRNDAATKGVAVVKVPWQSLGRDSDAVGVTARDRFAYRLTSNRPVTVYQFNPLAAVVTGASCLLFCSSPDAQCVNGRCQTYSYSNDASLLLPAHILGLAYVGLVPEHIASRSPLANSQPEIFGNNTLSIVSTKDGTQVTVKSTARTLASTVGTAVPAIAAGGSATFTLAKYEVLQLSSDNPVELAAGSTTGNLECGVNPFPTGGGQVCRVSSDLTGTVITSSDPIAVFGGSKCTLRGYRDTACDHVEEQLFPFVTWGQSFVAARTAPLRLTTGTFAAPANAGPDYYKIVAGCPDSQCPNGTTITLSSGGVPTAANGGAVLVQPSGLGCEPGTSLVQNNCRLRGGRFVEFTSKQSFTITADKPIQVAQMFAGQNATTGAVRPDQGDPSLVLLPPIEQWRSNYTVLTAPGIRDNYLGLVVDDARVASVTVNGAVITAGWTPIAGTTFKTNNVAVPIGTHTIQVAAKPGQTTLPGAGVTVYGFDSYVSYGYTGGLDLSTIVSGINPGG